MSTLSGEQKEYYERFRAELQKQLKRTFRMKRNLYDFAKECNIYMPYGLDKASSIMYIAEHLAKHEIKERYGESEWDKEFQDTVKNMKPEDKVGKPYHGVGNAAKVVKESKDGKILKTVPMSGVIQDNKNNNTNERKEKENATKLKAIREEEEEEEQA